MCSYEVMISIPNIQLFNDHVQKVVKKETSQDFEIFFTTASLSDDPFMGAMLICLRNENLYIKEYIDISFLQKSDIINFREPLINLIINTLKEKRPNLFI